MSQRVTDRRILDLVRRMLKAAVVMPDGTRVAVVEGAPQGGPLTPPTILQNSPSSLGSGLSGNGFGRAMATAFTARR
jgi:hypothetical protein